MTLKQKLVIKDIKEGIENPTKKTMVISKIMRKNGYAESSCNGGATRKFIRDYTKKIDFFDPEKIKKDIATTYRMAKKVKDITNMNRNNEHRSKIAGMITDKAEVIQIDKPDNQFSLNRLAGIKQAETQ